MNNISYGKGRNISVMWEFSKKSIRQHENSHASCSYISLTNGHNKYNYNMNENINHPII